jgi:SAM-dependent methyltransferase
MKIYKYKNYQEYKDCQKAAYQRKFKNVWAVEENIKIIAEYLKPFDIQKGLCHGVRQGHEMEWFKKYLPELEITGSDIGGSFKKDIVQWDFNIDRPEWLRAFDFIYSNSFDHAYSPKNTLQVWARQLKSGGFIILEYDRRQEHTGEISKGINKTDPVSIKFDELITLIPKWIKIKSIKILNMPITTFEWRKALITRIP